MQIFNKEKKMLGKGIYLKTNKTNEGAADTEFADVVLKSKTDVGEKREL